MPPEGRQHVDNAFIRYATTGGGDVKQLTNRDGFRLRIGRYRVPFDEDRQTILAVYIGKRETTTYRRR